VTYAFTPKKGAGPIRRHPTKIATQPIRVSSFGDTFLSHSLPMQGAAMAYIAPLSTNITHNHILLSSNYGNKMGINDFVICIHIVIG